VRFSRHFTELLNVRGRSATSSVGHAGISGAIIALLSIAHLIFFLPQKLIDIGAFQEYAAFLPLTAAPLLVVAFRQRHRNRLIFALGLIPLIVSIRVYDEVLVKLSRAALDQERAHCELQLSPDGKKLVIRGKRDQQSSHCIDDRAIQGAAPITICSPNPWTREEVSLGEEFSPVTVWHSLVDDKPIVVSRIKIDPDHAPFSPAIVQLRRFSTIFRHRRGSIILIMEDLPGLFSGATTGFYQQAWVHELLLPHHFWRSVVGRFDIRLLGRRVRIVGED
jgi:hypothetical protein